MELQSDLCVLFPFFVLCGYDKIWRHENKENYMQLSFRVNVKIYEELHNQRKFRIDVKSLPQLLTTV